MGRKKSAGAPHTAVPCRSRLLAAAVCAALILAGAIVWLRRPQTIELPYLTARNAAVMDVSTGRFLSEKDADAPRSPASLTKLMTLLLVLDDIESGVLGWEDTFTVTPAEAHTLGSKYGMRPGEVFTVRQLVAGAVMVSGCDCIQSLVKLCAPDEAAFVARMNQKAQDLGCEGSHFCNTNGLPDANHYTTAWDLWLIAKAARAYPDFMSIVGTIYHEVPATNLSEARQLFTTNYLISSYKTNYYLYKGAEGIKTGYTKDAGYCLVASATRGDRSLLSVVLGAERITEEDGTIITKSFTQTKRLFDLGFDGFERKILLGGDELVGEVNVELSQQQNTVKVHPAQEIERLLPVDMDPIADIDRNITYTVKTVEAPVTKGQSMGRIVLQSGDTVYADVELLADEDVAVSRLLVFRRDLLEFLHKPVLWYSLGGAAALAVSALILRAVLKARRKNYNRRQAARRGGGSSGYRGRRR